MKIKSGYKLRKIAGQNIVIPDDDNTAAFHGALTFNETGAFVWSLLENGATKEELLAAVTGKYDVTEDKATSDIEKLLEVFVKYGVIE